MSLIVATGRRDTCRRSIVVTADDFAIRIVGAVGIVFPVAIFANLKHVAGALFFAFGRAGDGRFVDASEATIAIGLTFFIIEGRAIGVCCPCVIAANLKDFTITLLDAFFADFSWFLVFANNGIRR